MKINSFLKNAIQNKKLCVTNKFKKTYKKINKYAEFKKVLSVSDLYYPDFKLSLHEKLIKIEKISNIFSTLSSRKLYLLDQEKLKKYLDKGAQIVLMNVELKSLEIRKFVDLIENSINHNLEANFIFCTQAGQKFSTHFDDHDIIIIQLEGEKEWTWYESQVKSNKISNDSKLPFRVNERKCVVQKKCVLKKGDVVFMPAFTPHKVVATGASLHLNLAINKLNRKNLIKRSDLNIKKMGVK